METPLPPVFGKEMQRYSDPILARRIIERSFPVGRSSFLSEETTSVKPFYFSTRDLLIIAVLAALGGVASTYINNLSDIVQAALGFAGGSQWAAGLHVIWIVLAAAILRKPGTGILIGILKGGVEMLSGNSHGVIILLVDLVAGLLVDFGFLLFGYKRKLLPYLVAGGLATGSNVLVFQMFATIPMNILGVTAILILFSVAAVSGVLFAGILPFLLVRALAQAGVITINEKETARRGIGWYIVIAVVILTALFAVFLRMTYRGPDTIEITGTVENTYQFPTNDFSPEMISREMEYRGVMTSYEGYPLAALISLAEPRPGADSILLEASDGYAFMLSIVELQSNENILLVQNGKGQDASFDVVGPNSSKAWVRNVTRITIIASQGFTIIGQNGDSNEFDPDQWVNQMDSTQIALPDGAEKLQGIPLWKVVEAYSRETTPTEVLVRSMDETVTFNWDEINEKDDLRLFTRIETDAISYVLAEMTGEVFLFPITEIEID